MPRYEKLFDLPEFSGGYISNSTPGTVNPNQMAYGSLNLRLSARGGVRKRKGYAKALSDADSSWTTHKETLGLHEFYDAAEFRCLVRIGRNTSTNDVRFEYNDADLIGDTGDWNAGSSIGTITSNEAYCTFRGFLNNLYIACPELTALKYLSYSSGFSVNSVSTSGSARTYSKPKGVEEWYDRLWTFCDASVEGGTYIFWTNTAGTSIDLDASYQIIPGEGPITGIKRVGDRLFVFKRREIFVISGGYDPSRALQIQSIPGSGGESVGCIAHRSIVSTGNDVFFLSEKGFYHTDGFRLTYIGEPIENDMENLDKTKLSRVCAVNYAKNSEVVWFLPYKGGDADGAWGSSPWGTAPWGGGSTSQRCFVFDYSAGAWCAPFTNQPFRTACIYTNENSVTVDDEDIFIVSGEDEPGHIFVWDYGETDDGTMTNANLVTHVFDGGDIGLVKILRQLWLQIGEVGSENAYVPFKVEVFEDAFGSIDSGVTAASSSTQQLSQGSSKQPEYTTTRHIVGGRGRTLRLRMGDYSDGTVSGGPFIIAAVSGVGTVKGRRS